MNMGDTGITVLAIFLAAIMMFVFPLLFISQGNEDIARLTAQTATVSTVDDVCNTGILSQDKYDAYIQKLATTGNNYDVEIHIQVLDENPWKKGAQTAPDKVGENIYYSEYESQIFSDWEKQTKELGEKNPFTILKEGDRITISAKNVNKTIAETIENLFYGITGKGSPRVVTSHSGVVTANGGK